MKSKMRSRSSRSRTYRRRKSYRGNRTRQTLGVGGAKLQYVTARCPLIVPIAGQPTIEETFAQYQLGILWQRATDATRPQNGIAGLVDGSLIWQRQVSVFDTARFVGIRQNWSQYAVTGLKIQYYPSVLMQTSGGDKPGFIAGAYMAGLNNYPDDFQAGYQALAEKPGFRPLKTPYAAFTKYIPLRNYSKKQNLVWQDVSSGIPDSYQDGGLGEAYSLIRMQLNETVRQLGQQGYFRITWYVKFRGQV